MRQLAISPHTGRVYLNQVDDSRFPILSTLTAFDSATYRVHTPGRTDLSMSLGPETMATSNGVAPGTYYLRLRGATPSVGGKPRLKLW